MQKTKSDENEEGSDILQDGSNFGVRRLKETNQPVLYTSETDAIPRDVLLDFLKSCVKMMLDTVNINEIVEDTFERKIGMNQSAIDFQRDVLQNNFQIEKDFGCKYLSMIPMKHEGDVELIESAKEFMFTAMRSYLNALRARSSRYKSSAALKPKAGTPMSRTTILEFFEGCNALSKCASLLCLVFADH